MNRSVGLFAYVWDITERGIPDFVAECVDVGVTELHVATCYHSGKFFLPKNSRSRVYFPEPGCLYALPTEGAFAGTLAPPLSRFASTRWLDELGEHATARGLSLAAWTVFFHNSVLGSSHPELTCRNVFGDLYPFALCPSNPVVQEYAAALCRVLKAQGIFGSIDLETVGYLGYFHGHHHEVTAVPAGPLELFLLSLCFCDSCCEAATKLGVNVEALVRQLRSVLLTKVNNDDASTRNLQNHEQLASLIALCSDLQVFLEMRFQTIEQLLFRLRSEAGSVKLSLCTSSFVGSPSNIWMEGIHLTRSRELVDSYNLLAYAADADSVNDDLVFCLALLGGDAARLNFTLNLGLPSTPSLENAMSKVGYALRKGVRQFSFFNYGFLGKSRVGWIKELSQCIRAFGEAR